MILDKLYLEDGNVYRPGLKNRNYIFLKKTFLNSVLIV